MSDDSNPHSLSNVLKREGKLSGILFAKEIIFSLVLACLVVVVYVLLYIGAVWNPVKYISRIDVIIVNDDAGFDVQKAEKLLHGYVKQLDNVDHAAGVIAAEELKKFLKSEPDKLPSLGDLLTKALTESDATKDLLDWHVVNSKGKDEKPLFDYLKERINDGDAWVGLYIPKNYSMSIFKAVEIERLEDQAKRVQKAAKEALRKAEKNIDQTNIVDTLLNAGGSIGEAIITQPADLESFANPIVYIYDQGRQSSTHNVISAVLKTVFVQISTLVSTALIGSPIGPFLTIILDPYFLGNPVQLRSENLHPVYANGMNMATYISPVVLWVICLVTINLLIKDSLRTDEGLAKSGVVKWYHILRWKIIVAVVFTAIESQVLTFVLWCLGVEFEKNYAIFWLAQWYAAVTFLFMQGAIYGLCGPDVWTLPTTILLIIQLTTGGAFISEELSNRFFYLGRGLPFYHAVRLNRTIIFDSFNRVYIDLLVMLAWLLGGALIGYLTGYVRLTRKIENLQAKNDTFFAAAGAFKNVAGGGTASVVVQS